MSGLFGRSSHSSTPEVYTGIQVSTSQYGQSKPLVYGRQRIPFNLGWYGNFNAKPVNGSQGGKGGGGSQISSYDYSAAFLAIICAGPIVGINRVFHDKKITTLANENLSFSLGGCNIVGSISGTVLTVTSASNASIVVGATLTGIPGVSSIPQNTTISSFGTGTGGTGTYNLNNNCGTVTSQSFYTTSPTWSFLSSSFPSQAIPYDHDAYVATPGFDFGSSASMPNLSFEIDGLLGWNISVGMFDASPARIIADYLLDPVHGAAFQGTLATLTGNTNTYEAYCGALNIFLSPYENTQRSATDFLKEILEITNSDAVMSAGVLNIVPYGDKVVSGTTPDGTNWSYTPNLTPQFIFTDSDYCPKEGEEPVKLHRKQISDTYNNVYLEYVNRADYYNVAIVNANDIGDISKSWMRTMPTKSLHQITSDATARIVAQLIMQASLYDRNEYEFTVRPDYMGLEPMDIVAINDVGLGLVNQVCRVLEVELDPLYGLKIRVLEVPGVTRSTSTYNWQAAQGYAANYATAPGSVLTPSIFVSPFVDDTTAGIQIGIAVAPSAASTNWNGCNVYCSVDGGTTYSYVGRVTSAARYGTITGSIAAGTADPDVTTTIPVALSDTALQLSTSVTHAEADSNQTLILVDSGANAEVMSYGAAALVSAGNYNLSYLHRGLYGSINGAHSSGAQFVRIDGSIFQLSLPNGYSGQTVYFKFTSFNTWGQATEALSGVTAYPYLVPGVAISGFAGIGQFKVVGNGALDSSGNYYKPTTGSSSGTDNAAVTQQSFDTCSISAAYAHAGAGLNPLNGTCEIGLTEVQTSTNHTLSGTFAMVAAGGTWTVIESGVAITNCGAVNIGDTALITYDGYVVRYYLNGTLQQTTGFSGSTFYGYASCFDPGTVLSQLAIGPYFVVTPSQFITNQPNIVTLSDTKISKPNGSAGWNAGALSEFSYYTMHFAAKTNNVNTVAPLGRCMFGLCTPAHATGVIAGDYTKLDYAWYSSENQWIIYENGVAIATASSTAALSDVAWITCDQTNVRYYLNDPLNPVRTIGVSTTPLFGGICLYDTGALNAGLNSIAFGPGTSLQLNDTAEIAANAATITDVAHSTPTGVSLTGVTGVTTLNPNMSMPNSPNYACTVIVTMNITARQSTGTVGDVSLLCQFADDNVTKQNSTSTYKLLSATDQQYTLQWEFTHAAANVGLGKVWAAANPGNAADTLIYGPCTLQVEYVIR